MFCRAGGFVKIAKFVLNLIYTAFVFIFVSVLCVGVYSAVLYQTDDTSARIYFVEKDDSISYYDPLIYWGDDLSTDVPDTSIENTKLRVSNWFGWKWWKKAGGAVDQYFVDPSARVLSGIFTPLNSADKIKTYYNTDISDFTTDFYSDSDAATRAKFNDMSAIYWDIDLSGASNDELQGKLEEIVAEDPDAYKLSENDEDGNGVADVYDISDNYSQFYSILYYTQKYNGDNKEVYGKWFDKYVYKDSAGERHIKTSVYSVYILYFIIIVLTLFYVWENPIDIKKNPEGATEVGHMFRRTHIKHKHKKNDDED